MIKARWLFIPGLLCVIVGFILPYVMMLFFMPEVETSLWSWLALISVYTAAAGVYSWIGLILIIIGIILIILSIVVFILGRKKTNRKRKK